MIGSLRNKRLPGGTPTVQHGRGLLGLTRVLFLFLALSFYLRASAQNLELGPDTHLVFTGVEDAKRILATRDDYLVNMTPFDREIRMKTNGEVSESEFVAFLTNSVRAWSAADSNRLTRVLSNVTVKLAPWHLPFPSTIQLIKTDGREEFGFYYTRQNAVVFPATAIRGTGSDIVLHELFHVLSRQNPALRTNLYKILGFTRINDIPIPAGLEQHQVLNPDGVENGWLITVTNRGTALPVVPSLYVPANMSPDKLGNPLDYFRLMVVTNVANSWKPVVVSGQPRMLRIGEVTGYYEQIGSNTDYLIHPDEILAENFVQLINGKTNVPTPRILKEMERLFLK